MKNFSWKTLKTRVVHETPWLKLLEDSVLRPDGSTGKYTFVETNAYVIVVALTEQGDLILIDQDRYPVHRCMMEFPAGGLNPDEIPLSAAKRELHEETGYTSDEWHYVGEIFESISISHHKGFIFVAKNATRISSGTAEPDEHISAVHTFSTKNLEKEIANGKVVDALTPAVYLRARKWL